MHEKLDYSNPKTFCQKIQWLKINDRKEEYSILVDKYRVKDYISRELGSEYVIPLLAVYERPEDIDFGQLPDAFVLKANHTSAVKIVRDKKKVDLEMVRAEIKKDFDFTHYDRYRESGLTKG